MKPQRVSRSEIDCELQFVDRDLFTHAEQRRPSPRRPDVSLGIIAVEFVGLLRRANTLLYS